MNHSAENEGIRILEEHICKAIPTTRTANVPRAKPDRNEGIVVDNDEGLVIDLAAPDFQLTWHSDTHGFHCNGISVDFIERAGRVPSHRHLTRQSPNAAQPAS